MANYNATIDVKGRAGSVGQQVVASGYYDLAGALADEDTITFTNIIPENGANIVFTRLISPELDTNASPTGTLTVGTSDDPDGFVTTTNMGLPAQAPVNGYPLVAEGNGALIGTAVRDRDVIVTVTAAVATSITEGRVRLYIGLEALPA